MHTFVFGSVGIVECALAVLLALAVVAHIPRAVLELVHALHVRHQHTVRPCTQHMHAYAAVAQAVLVLALVRVAVGQHRLACAVSCACRGIALALVRLRHTHLLHNQIHKQAAHAPRWRVPCSRPRSRRQTCLCVFAAEKMVAKGASQVRPECV